MSLESQLNRNYRRPEQPKAPLRRNQASRPQRQFVSAPERPKAPLRTNQQKSRPVVRPTRTTFNSRRQQAARNELFQRRLLALSMLDPGPAPSPDRTTGREQAGFASSAFTAHPLGDAANAFEPDVLGAKHSGYGARAGNPKQQAIAHKDAIGPGGVAENSLSGTARAVELALRRVAANSSVGAGVGNVIAQQTWDKLAPLFQRSSKDMPAVTFGDAGPFAGHASIGGGKPSVTISPTQLSGLFSRDSKARGQAAQQLRGLFAHEDAHTQQRGGGERMPFKNRSMGSYNPRLEGGADAFESAVAPLLGNRSIPPSPRGEYGAAQIKFGNDLRKVLIGQFPRASKRLTPIKQRRVNLAQ